MSKISLTLPDNPVTGKQISFIAPCAGDDVIGLTINGTDYVICDTIGRDIAGTKVWDSGAIVSVILNVEDAKAYIQNPALNGSTSSYMETKTVTLSAGSWLTDAMEGYVYRVDFPGVTADPTKTHVFYSVIPDHMDMEMEASRCWVRLSVQGDGYLVFKALNGTAPTIDIDMNILVVGV